MITGNQSETVDSVLLLTRHCVVGGPFLGSKIL